MRVRPALTREAISDSVVVAIRSPCHHQLGLHGTCALRSPDARAMIRPIAISRPLPSGRRAAVSRRDCPCRRRRISRVHSESRSHSMRLDRLASRKAVRLRSRCGGPELRVDGLSGPCVFHPRLAVRPVRPNRPRLRQDHSEKLLAAIATAIGHREFGVVRRGEQMGSPRDAFSACDERWRIRPPGIGTAPSAATNATTIRHPGYSPLGPSRRDWCSHVITEATVALLLETDGEFSSAVVATAVCPIDRPLHTRLHQDLWRYSGYSRRPAIQQGSHLTLLVN
jgi:hypothetical protein